ncbi:MAG: glycosyltransferase family 4 protein, partial [Phycisphaerales bacterium]|nr:glycosyltransferase family 4 protein [Phycisphaerales bacterium]
MKVVILNQYYAPDVASTGHLLYELANDLSINGEDVDVITCRPSYGPPETWQPCPRKERDVSGVMVRRMLATRFSKDNMLGRIVNSITFLVPLAARMMFRMKRGEVFLYTTNPPYLGVVGTMVGLVRRHRYVVLLHDAYPQMAVWVGKIRKGGLIDRTWHLLNKWMYRRAKQTIVLCEAAKDLVCDTYGIDPEKVHVIPNWADGEFLHPIDKADSPFAIEHDLVEPLTLLYSGNMGLYYDFDTILNAATLLRGEDVRFVFIGGGGVRSRIEDEIEKRNLDNSMMFPHQPFDTLNESLNACDVSFVTIAKDIEGISFPSKLYTSLAVGKVIIAICEPHSSLRTIVEESGCGMWVELGDADGLVRAV